VFHVKRFLTCAVDVFVALFGGVAAAPRAQATTRGMPGPVGASDGPDVPPPGLGPAAIAGCFT
jgi:hypothetical protein